MDIDLNYYNHCDEKTLVEMCMGNMIMEYRAILENLEISQFAQLLQKARKTAQSVRSSSDRPKERKFALQAMAQHGTIWWMYFTLCILMEKK